MTLAEILAAPAGSTVDLEPGYYGDLNLSRPLTIRGPREVVFNSVTVRAGAAGSVLEGFTVALTPTDTTASFSSVIRLYQTADVILRGLAIRSDRAPATSTKSKPGELTSRGVTIDGCERVLVEGCDISQCVDGIVPLKGRDLVLTDNRIHHTRGSPVSGAGTMGLVITGNRLSDVTPVGWGDTANDGDHADMVHLWNRGLTVPMGPVIIRGNVIDQGDGVAILGIFLQDNSLAGFTGVEIAANIIHLGNAQGIAVGGLLAGCRIVGNVLTPTPGTLDKRAPVIVLRGATDGVVVAANVLGPSKIIAAAWPDNTFLTPATVAELVA